MFPLGFTFSVFIDLSVFFVAFGRHFDGLEVPWEHFSCFSRYRKESRISVISGASPGAPQNKNIRTEGGRLSVQGA